MKASAVIFRGLRFGLTGNDDFRQTIFVAKYEAALLGAVAVAIWSTGCSSRTTSPGVIDAGRDLVLRNVTIVDTHDGHLSPGMRVVIKAGKIARIDPNQADLPGGAIPVVDGHGKFLVPGFVDGHTHVLHGPDATRDEAVMLANGITGFRQMDGTAELLRERRDGRLYESIFAPRVLAMPGRVLLTTNAFSPQEGIAEVDRQKAQGADFIKAGLVPPATFYAVGAEAKRAGLPFEGHLPPGVDPVEAVNAGYRSIEHLGPGATMLIDCSTEEDALKREIAAHPQRKPPPIPDFLVQKFLHKLVLDPLLAEIFFNHGTIANMQRIVDTFDETKCKRVAAAIAKSGSWQVPTLIRLRTSEFADAPEYQNDPNFKYESAAVRREWAEVSRDFSKKITPAQKVTVQKFWLLQLKLARMLDDAGVPMLAGTDSAGGAIVAGFSLHQEFALLAQDGFSPLKILQMTTLNAARFYGRETTMGSVEVGRDADLVLLDGNPITSAANLDRIEAVVRNGTFYSREALDAKLREVAGEVSAR
jgi:imidazolonepropionase-like amidohydrolase